MAPKRYADTQFSEDTQDPFVDLSQWFVKFLTKRFDGSLTDGGNVVRVRIIWLFKIPEIPDYIFAWHGCANEPTIIRKTRHGQLSGIILNVS